MKSFRNPGKGIALFDNDITEFPIINTKVHSVDNKTIQAVMVLNYAACWTITKESF